MAGRAKRGLLHSTRQSPFKPSKKRLARASHHHSRISRSLARAMIQLVQRYAFINLGRGVCFFLATLLIIGTVVGWLGWWPQQLFFFLLLFFGKRTTRKNEKKKTDHKIAAHVRAPAPTHVTPRNATTSSPHAQADVRQRASKQASSKKKAGFHLSKNSQECQVDDSLSNKEGLSPWYQFQKKRKKVACGRAGGILVGPTGASPFT